MLVKSQASLSKLSQQHKERESVQAVDTVTKAEIEYLLDKKVNKTDFQIQIEGLVKSIKKSRKLAALSGGRNQIIHHFFQLIFFIFDL